ncbi:MAG TPA: hypothetical protein VN025_14735 [Candidatus Dormibacteraeota bacterium]|nr:hypothetical protein [Candidatus Dormibacteraeota bacterium]
MPPDIENVPRREIHNDKPRITEESYPATPLMTENKNESTAVKETNCFVPQNWHLPYAKALIEKDQIHLPTAIALAERAILNRYLELHAIPEPLDERLDLWRAVEALLELKKKETR